MADEQNHKKIKASGSGEMHLSKKFKTESIYGPQFNDDWPTENYKPVWIEENLPKTGEKAEVNVESLIAKSKEFPIKFPLETGRCHVLKTDVPMQTLNRNINSTYPILHERVLDLYLNFIKFKREFGSQVERNLYKDMDIIQLTDRLLKNRAVSFWGPGDKYTLLSKVTGIAKWDTIGTDQEQNPLVLEDLISYDEIKLSALLYVSGYTHFVNDGNRKNCGVTETDRKSLEEEGIIIGLIGARLKRKHVMEYQDIIVTKEQNNSANGFSTDKPKNAMESKNQAWRKLWSNFYEEQINSYSDVYKIVQDSKETCRFYPARAQKAYFDNMYYKKRLSLAFDALLFEANHRAKEASKMAYIHMVGIGLGVWRNAEHQEPAFLEVFIQRLQALREKTHNIADVHFAYFHTRPTDQVKDGMIIEDSTHPSGGVRVHISKREPASKLTGEDAGKLLIATYAWDGNAQPGNEYWCGMLKSTGDSAAACSTQVAELHNGHINTEHVCGANLHVASRKFGVIHYAEYMDKCNQG